MTSTMVWPDRLLTLRDWQDLAADEQHHVECVEGILIVAPKPLPRHQLTMSNLASTLNRRIRQAGLLAVPDVEVLIAERPLTVRAPDVVIVDRDAARANPPRFAANEVRLVVEIVSEGSGRTDRVTKLSEYAEAGIPEYWIIDLGDPATLSVHALAPGIGYAAAGQRTGQFRLTACGVDVDLDLDELSRL